MNKGGTFRMADDTRLSKECCTCKYWKPYTPDSEWGTCGKNVFQPGPVETHINHRCEKWEKGINFD
jgi:hypothetical protein